MLRSKQKKRIGIILIIVGVLFVSIASWLLISNNKMEYEAAIFSELMAQTLLQKINSSEQPEFNPAPVADTSTSNPPPADAPEDEEYYGSYYVVDQAAYLGVLNIPVLNLYLPVNCDWSYPALRRTPCRFSGGILTDDLVIAGHNLAGHFAGISDLVVGDLVYLTDAEVIVHRYQIAEITTVPPSSTYIVTHSDFELTLFTCTYGGQARVIVRCVAW